MQNVFITGTDTGVGKTVVAAALLACLRGRGIDAIPMKPVQTGCLSTERGMVAPDLQFSLAMTRTVISDEQLELMAPYRFEPACSPHLAAAQARTQITIDHIKSRYHALAEQHDTIVVEGAGGVLVPLSETQTMVDLMTALELQVVLVARPGLGTINHSLLSLLALERAGIRIAGIVFNSSQPHKTSIIEEDNRKIIEKLGNVPVIGHLPFLCNAESIGAAAFGVWAATHLDEAVEKLIAGSAAG